MKAKDIEGCEQCPLREEYCSGGMTSGAGGQPIEPPCTSWDDDTELEDLVDNIGASQLAYEEHLDREHEKEKEKKHKQEIKNKRAIESRLHVRSETKKIKRLWKQIESNSRLNSFGRAMSMTNSMFKISDDRPDRAVTELERQNEVLKEKIKEIEAIKKTKLKELRKSRQ